MKGQEKDQSKLPERLSEILRIELGADVPLWDCVDMVKRVSVHTHPLFLLELVMEKIANKSKRNEGKDEESQEKEVEKEPIMLNQAALRMKAGHSYEITCLVMSPDGTLLASADTGGWVLVWDLVEGDQFRFRAHESSVKCLAFADSQGGSGADIIFSVGLDRSLKAFDVHTGEETMCVKDAHDEEVTGMSVARKGAPMCVTCSLDRTCRVWGLGAPATLVDDFEDHVAIAERRSVAGSVGRHPDFTKTESDDTTNASLTNASSSFNTSFKTLPIPSMHSIDLENKKYVPSIVAR